MMNTVKHLQYQEAKEFQGEHTSRFVGFYTFILMTFQRAGLVCGLKHENFELTIVFVLFFFFFFLCLLPFQKFVWFLTKVLEIKKMCEGTHFFNPYITCTTEFHF